MTPWPVRLSLPSRLSLAGLSAVLNGIAFIFNGWFALIANVPLLIALWGAPSASWTALLGGTVGFFAGLHIYGVLNYGQLLFWGFGTYTCSQMVLYALLHRALWHRGAGTLPDVLLPAWIWALTEWVRTVGPLAMPASYVGCLADEPLFAPWLGLARFSGGLGVSTLIALVQSALFHLVAGPKTHRKAALGALGVVGLCGVIGALAPPPTDGRALQLVAVQGGLANHQYETAQADPSAQREVIKTYEVLTKRALDTGAALVVWPETAVRAPVLETPALRARLAPRPTDTGVLVAGLIGQDQAGRHYNEAVALGPGGVLQDRIAKVRLVPNAEAHFTPGEAFRPLNTTVGKLGALICLESVYPEAARALTQAGAELLLVMSNDAGFGRSPITKHMTNRAIVRAVENGRWLLRVGQSGISTLIDPTGHLHGELGIFKADLLEGEAQLRNEWTLYTRFGPWWLIIVLAGLGVSIWSKRRLKA